MADHKVIGALGNPFCHDEKSIGILWLGHLIPWRNEIKSDDDTESRRYWNLPILSQPSQYARALLLKLTDLPEDVPGKHRRDGWLSSLSEQVPKFIVFFGIHGCMNQPDAATEVAAFPASN